MDVVKVDFLGRDSLHEEVEEAPRENEKKNNMLMIFFFFSNFRKRHSI